MSNIPLQPVCNFKINPIFAEETAYPSMENSASSEAAPVQNPVESETRKDKSDSEEAK